MANLNYLKLVLVEKNKTEKWLADELGKTSCTVSKWSQNTIQPDLKNSTKSQIFWELILPNLS